MADAPKMLSDRISFSRDPEKLTVVITQEIPRSKEALLFAWIVAWMGVGSVFIYYWMIADTGSSDRIFFAVSSAFWVYFFVRIFKVILWRKIGRELIMVKGETLTITNAYSKFGKPQHYHTGNVQRFGVIPYDFTKFGQFMDRASWVIGGETLGFEHLGRKVLFGKQLGDREAAQLARIIEKALREVPARYRRDQRS
jgi:hypothetical protein